MRRLLLALTAVLATLSLTACAPSDVTAADAYKIGCPAVDSAVAGGSVASKATLTGLRALYDSGQLDTQPQEWLAAAIQAIETADTEKLPAEAKRTIVDGCAANGYPLTNLK